MTGLEIVKVARVLDKKRKNMISLFVAYFLIIAFMVIERRLRIGENAKSMVSGEADRQSTGRLGQAFALAVLLLLFTPAA